MKKLFFTFFALVLAVGLTYSQEDPDKALSKAGRALSSYNLDPANNAEKLTEAVDMIEIAVKGAETKGKVKTWQTRGEIYNAVADKDLGLFSVDPNHVPVRPDAPSIASNSFMKALELAEKKYETKDALKGLDEAGKKLNAFGNNQIQRADYANAFKSLDLVLTVSTLLQKNGENPIVQETDMGNHKFVIAYCAQISGEKARAKELYKDLYDAGTDEATVYAQYFNMLLAEGDKDAIKILEKGRARFPENSEILFAEINYYISVQRYDILEIKLKEAIEREPKNPSVYSALGNVYMNLFTAEFEKDKNSAQAKKYFDSSMDYFNQALKIDANNFDALYSVGSLYFNKAVEVIKAAANLGMSQDDQKKYKEMEKQSSELMNSALPYFQKTEAINPDDANTLIALSEIFARMNEFDKSKEFKERLQKVRDGGTNAASYFKKN